MITVKYPALSILGATTPADMAKNITYDQWENGSMARYLMMFRDNPLPYTPDYISPLPPEAVTFPLRQIHEALPHITANDLLETEQDEFHPIQALITPEAHKQYLAYTKAVYYDMLTADLDERLHGNYRRMHMQMVKIALAVAIMDWQIGGRNGAVTIELGHMALAQTLAEKGRASLHKMMPIINQSADARTQRTLVSVLKSYPEGLTLKELTSKIGRNHKELRSSIEVLIDAGEVESYPYHPSGAGRPTTLYRLIT
jgi:hypothetical protein